MHRRPLQEPSTYRRRPVSGLPPRGAGRMAKRRRVMVVEDETDLAELVRHNVEREGYACRVTSNGRAAITEILADPPDLVLRDRMLPLMTGEEVLAQMKRDPRTSAIPVIMLTAKAEESDQLVGLSLGADDYV